MEETGLEPATKTLNADQVLYQLSYTPKIYVSAPVRRASIHNAFAKIRNGWISTTALSHYAPLRLLRFATRTQLMTYQVRMDLNHRLPERITSL